MVVKMEDDEDDDDVFCGEKGGFREIRVDD